MELSTTYAAEQIWVSVSGRVDALESPQLLEAIRPYLNEETPFIGVDLSTVDYLDSSGLAVLVKTWRHQIESGLRFAIKAPADESARRIFSLAGFDKVFDGVEMADAAEMDGSPNS